MIYIGKDSIKGNCRAGNIKRYGNKKGMAQKAIRK